MTELTFAELTALIAANGLTVNDRYLITDKNWTIIAISTNAYRIVVPIVTEVTLSQLNALIAANGLNEGLQYHCVDTNIDWLLLATGSNTLIAATGTLKLYNGSVLPTAISADIILIDTGVIDTDISMSTGNPIAVSLVPNYLDKVEVDAVVDDAFYLQINEIIAGVGFTSIFAHADGLQTGKEAYSINRANRMTSENFFICGEDLTTLNGSLRLVMRFVKSNV